MKNIIIKFLAIQALLIIGIIFICKVFDIPFIGVDSKELCEWSIGIYKISNGNNTLMLTPHPEINNPILTAKDIKDRKAEFVADPFLVYENRTYYMFFEVLSNNNGDIGLATSADGLKWKYQGIVLDEPFHLSYPCVFNWKGKYYMVPEVHQTNSIRLYESVNFPYKWKFSKTLLEGKDFVDPTILLYKDKWWLFVSTVSNENLYLYYSDSLDAIWKEHPESPVITGDKNKARCGGNILNWNGKLIRIAQDDSPSYGNSVRAFEILSLTSEKYQERELENSPLLIASTKGWNSTGMHQLSAYRMNDKEWIACVDGKKPKYKYYVFIELPSFLGKFLCNLVKK